MHRGASEGDNMNLGVVVRLRVIVKSIRLHVPPR